MKKSVNIETHKKIGRHIQDLREERNIGISEIAEKTGIRVQYLRKIEEGRAYRVNLGHFDKIAKVMKLNISEIFNV